MKHFFRWKTLVILVGMFVVAAASGCAMFDQFQDDEDDEHESYYQHRKR